MKKQLDIGEASMKSFPLPVTLVSCKGCDGVSNIITITYLTGVNEEPPMLGIAVRPEKHSNGLIHSRGDFVVNVPTTNLLKEIDYCGTRSGRDVNKFRELGLTPLKSSFVSSPSIQECPVNIECRVVKKVSLPSHDFFIGEVKALHVDDRLVAEGMPNFDALDFVLTTYLDYRRIGGKIGTAFKVAGAVNLLNKG